MDWDESEEEEEEIADSDEVSGSPNMPEVPPVVSGVYNVYIYLYDTLLYRTIYDVHFEHY